MREEIWVHPLTGIRFEGRESYLDFMRDRYRKRMAARRLVDHRANMLRKMQDIHDVTSVDDIERFLNNHIPIIESYCMGQRSTLKVARRFSITIVSEDSESWLGRVGMGYDRTEFGTYRNYASVPNAELTGLLCELGIVSLGGGGNQRNLSYTMKIMKAKYKMAVVMDMMAA